MRIFNKFLIPFLLLPLTFFAQTEIENNPFVLYEKSVKAFEEKNYSLYLQLIEKAIQIVPEHPSFVYQLARAQAANGRNDEALKNLRRAAMMGAAPTIEKFTGFESISGMAAFKEAVELFKKNAEVKGTAQIAFKIPQKDLIAEGIAYDPVNDRFYVSSIYRRKIVEVSRDGSSRDFIHDKQDGIWGVVGMEVDASRRRLWAAHGNLGDETGIIDPDPKTAGHTGVFLYDLVSRKLVKKYLLAPDPGNHFLNDLAIAKNGDVYISDSTAGCIYRIPNDKELEKLVCPEGMYFPNGIALTDDDHHLYVGHVSGISVMDTRSFKFQTVHPPENASTVGVDGMVTYGNSIIVNQAFANVERVTRFYTSDDLVRFSKAEVLQANQPVYVLPTTGVTAKNAFYFIANSQLRSYDEKGNILPLEKLQETIILKIDL